MAENRCSCSGGSFPNLSVGKESVCIDTYRVLDSCRDKDCFENTRVYLTEFGQEIIDHTTNVRTKSAHILWTCINVEPVQFNRGFYQVSIRFYVKLCCEGCVNLGRAQEFDGVAVVEKKVILYGSEGCVNIYRSSVSDEFCPCTDNLSTSFSTNMPIATVEVAEPVILGTRVVEPSCCNFTPCCVCSCDSIPEHVCGCMSGALTQNLKEVTREKYDYAAFLKKFAVMGEVMRINDEEFDYVYYTYGLKLYDKMPLIEPLEYKDVKRIREFVIAIDTSGSTSGELVQKFLQKTYNILMESESFFSKVNVHIIQCDADIQEDAKIANREEFDRYIKTMQIRGLGGTDFRPVFQYADKLIAEKEFANLKGLIYFTDGFGAFPAQKPGYETAFVFIDNEINNYEVPPWAIKLVLRKNEI